MADLTILAILTVIAVAFYTVMYLLGRIFNARNIMQIAVTNGIDALFTIVLAFILVELVKDGDNSVLSKAAVYFVNATVGGVNEVNLSKAFEQFYNRTYNNVTDMTFTIDERLLKIGNEKRGVMTYQLSGGGSDSLGALSDIAGGLPGASSGSESHQISLATGIYKAIAGLAPSASNAMGFGGAYSIAARRLSLLRNHLSTLYGLLIYVNELRNVVKGTIVFLIIGGAVMRILLISKGGGSFLMAMGLSLAIILPASLLFGFALMERAINGLSLSWQSIPDLPGEQHIGFYYLDEYTKPMSTKALDTFKLDDNAGKVIFLIFAYVIVISLSLLAVISTSAGLSALFGAEVGIWLLGQIGRLA